MDDYERAQFAQALKNAAKKPAHLGLAGERCPKCGEEIETLLNTEGKNPIRTCWKCEAGENK